MSVENTNTLHTYDSTIEKYIEGTVNETSGFQKEWLDLLLEDMPHDASLLEIGSAFGRDARYILSKGYSLQLTDGSIGFVEHLRKCGYEAELLNIVNKKPKGTYDAVIACAVFLHFTDDDFMSAVGHVRDSLCDDGRFAFSVKLGKGEEWSSAKMNSPRYFNYFTPDKIENLLKQARMKTVDMQICDNKWLHITAKKTKG